MKKITLSFLFSFVFANAFSNCSYTLYPSVSNAHCNQSDGILTIAASNGMSNTYTYSWSTGATDNGTAVSISGLTAGTYSVVVIDGSACMDTAYFNIININGPSSSVSSTSDVLCYGSCNGTAQISVIGGTPTYSYSWSTNPAQTTNSATGLCAGTYTVQVTDAAGCMSSSVVTIIQPASALLGSVSGSSTVMCFGQSTGDATVIAVGGTPNYTYSWSNGQTTNTATGLSAGSYSVTITDATGCSAITSVGITQPSNLSILSTTTSASCNSTNGTASISVIGGTPTYMYSWSNGQTTATATGLASGTYSVTVTDAMGCTATTTLTIGSASSPISITTNVTGSSAIASVSGGTKPYTCLWSTGDTSYAVSGLTAGSYTVTITDANGCTASDVVTIVGFNKITNELNNITLSPNPANNFIILDFGAALKNDYNIHIVNILGSEVLSSTIYSGNSIKTIDTSRLEAGIYFINLNNKSYKFIKQ